MAFSVAEKETVNRPCICCGGDNDAPYLRMRFPEYPGVFEYRQCRDCELVFNSPRLKDLSQLYRGDYFYFWKSAAFMRQRMLGQVSRLIRPVEPLLRGKRVLEVGAARGHFLYVLRQMGYDAHGVELSAEGIAAAEKHLGVSNFHGTVEAYAESYQGPRYDLVVSSCVLEHVSDPRLFLQACGKLLHEDGIMVFDVPNMNSANVPDLGRAWPYFQKYHVYLFNQRSVSQLLPNCGFELLDCYSYNNTQTSERDRQRMKQMRLLLIALDRAFLYRLVRRRYRGKQPGEEETSHAVKSLTPDELRSVQAFSETKDARRPWASTMQGDHLVVVGRRAGSAQ